MTLADTMPEALRAMKHIGDTRSYSDLKEMCMPYGVGTKEDKGGRRGPRIPA